MLAGTSKRYEALELVEPTRPTRSSRRSGVERPRRRPGSSSPRRRDPQPRPRQEPQAPRRSSAPTTSRPRSGRWPGATGRCSAWTASRTADDWRLTARLPAPARRRGVRPGARPGRCSRAATSCSIAASTRRSGSRARASTSRSTAARPRSPAATAARRFGWELPRTRRTGNAGAVRDAHHGRRPRHRELREPGAEPLPLAHQQDGLHRRPDAHRRPGQRRHRLRRRSPTTTSATPATAGILADHRRTSRSAASQYSGAGKDLAAARKPGDARGQRRRRSRSSAYDAIAKGYYAGKDETGQLAAVAAAGAQTGIEARPQGRRRRRHRLPALGHRVPRYSRSRRQQQLARDIIDAGRRHDHRQPRPLGRGDGGLQGQADLVRARQLRLRPDLVRADDGGHHPRADVPRRGAASRSGCGRTSSSTRPSPTSWTRPATAGS